MKKALKKGFTIVELAIVIAVIAILAAVLVPTITNLVMNAKVSSDTALVRNLNTALAAEEAKDGKNTTMSEALADAEEYGYLVEKLTPVSNGDILWDKTSDRFILVNEGNVVAGEKTATKDVELWKISDTYDEGEIYSVYLYRYTGDGNLTVHTGLDVGDSNVASVSYVGGTQAQEVMIRTNGGALTVNAPLDSVIHYDKVDKVIIEQVADHSYYEYGTVAVSMEVNDGHVIVETKGSVNELIIPESASTDTKVEIQANSAVNTLVVDSVTASVDVNSSAMLKNVVASVTNENITVPESVGATKVEKTFVGTAEELKSSLEAGQKYIVFTTDIASGAWSSEDNVGASITSDVVIDGAGNDFTTTAGRAIWIAASNVNVTIKNLNIIGGDKTERGVQVNIGCVGITLLMDHVNISNISHYGINITNDAGVDILMTNSKVTAWGALNLWSANYSVRVESSVLEGVNDKGYNAVGWNDFATVVLEGDTTNKTNDHSSIIDIVINNSELIAKSTTGNKQAAISFHSQSIANRITLDDTKITLDGDNTFSYIDSGDGNELIVDGKLVKTSQIETFAIDVSGIVVAADKKTATGTVTVNYIGKEYTFDLSQVTVVNGSNDTNYLFYVEDGNYYLSLDIEVASGYANGFNVYLGEYYK